MSILKGKKNKEVIRVEKENKKNIISKNSIINSGITGVQEQYFPHAKREEIPFMIKDNPLNIIKLRKQDQIPYWKEVIERNPLAYAIAPQEIRRNIDYALIAVKENPLLFRDAPSSIKRNYEFQLETINSGAASIFKEHISNLHYMDNTPEESIKFLAEIFSLQESIREEESQIKAKRKEEKSEFIKPHEFSNARERDASKNIDKIRRDSNSRISPEVRVAVEPKRKPAKLSNLIDIIREEDSIERDKSVELLKKNK